MPNIKSAKKRVLVTEKKAAQNKMIKSALKTQIKKFMEPATRRRQTSSIPRRSLPSIPLAPRVFFTRTTRQTRRQSSQRDSQPSRNADEPISEAPHKGAFCAAFRIPSPPPRERGFCFRTASGRSAEAHASNKKKEPKRPENAPSRNKKGRKSTPKTKRKGTPERPLPVTRS